MKLLPLLALLGLALPLGACATQPGPADAPPAKRVSSPILVAESEAPASDDASSVTPEQRAEYEALLASYAGRPAIVAVGSARQAMGSEMGAMTVDMTFELHAAKPLQGWMTMDFEGAMIPPEFAHAEFVADGEGVYQIDANAKTYSAVSDRWESFLIGIAPMRAWCGEDVGELESLAVEAASDMPGVRRWTLGFPDQDETLWIDAAGDLKRAEVVTSMDDQDMTVTLEFERWETPAEPDLAAFVRSLPEGFTEADPGAEYEKSLLAVGDPAPELSVTGMDDAPLALAALAGKTVLLNFWFRL
jgi:hypothetical protein